MQRYNRMYQAYTLTILALTLACSCLIPVAGAAGPGKKNPFKVKHLEILDTSSAKETDKKTESVETGKKSLEKKEEKSQAKSDESETASAGAGNSSSSPGTNSTYSGGGSTSSSASSSSSNSSASSAGSRTSLSTGKSIKKGAAAEQPKEEDYLKLLMQDQQALDLKGLGENVAKIRRQITDNPNEAFLRFKLGTALYLLGDLEGAASELTTSININPASAFARAQVGKVLELASRHMEALTQFRRAVEMAPNQAEIHFLFGESLMHGGNVPEAINEYRRAISLKPSAEALAALSEGLYIAGDNHGAMNASRQAVSLDATLARAQVALTNALLKSGDKSQQ